jgi:hypothetical protein
MLPGAGSIAINMGNPSDITVQFLVAEGMLVQQK